VVLAFSPTPIAPETPVRNDNRERTLPLVRLLALCGPGDDGEPAVTVTLPERLPGGDSWAMTLFS
jgi:hypothetical protein